MFFTQVTRIGRQYIRETRDLVANRDVGRVIMTATDSLFVAPVSRHLSGRDLAEKISDIAPSLSNGGRLHLKTEGVYQTVAFQNVNNYVGLLWEPDQDPSEEGA